MNTLEFLKECEEMAIHNLNCYENKPKYQKQFEKERSKLKIINYLKVLVNNHGDDFKF